MEAIKAISKEGQRWKCKKHPSYPGDIICLDVDTKERVMCFLCLQANPVPIQNMISIGCVLAANQNDILEAYPPLKDQELSEKLKYFSSQQSLEEIDLYFKKLREDFEREVKAAQQRAKQILIKQEQAKQLVLDGYKRIAEIEKLKDLIVSDKESAEKDLDQFIKEKWNKAAKNRKFMLDLMRQFDGQHFSSDEPNTISNKMIESLKSINFFKQSIHKEEINLIKSTYSQELTIQKMDNSIYQIKQEASNSWGQAYLDPILNPSLKYILQIELEIKPGNTSNHLMAGIVKDEGKDNGYGWGQSMCYCDNTNSFGITKYIKGNIMQSGSKATGKHSFEIRIHLDQRLLRVASLPDYSSIAELDDPKKIYPKVNYRFFLAIYYQGDTIRLNKVSVVDKFDEKM